MSWRHNGCPYLDTVLLLLNPPGGGFRPDIVHHLVEHLLICLRRLRVDLDNCTTGKNVFKNISQNVVLLPTFSLVINVICDHEDCNDVTVGAITSQITSLTIVYSTVYSGVDQRKHQSSASLAFVRGIQRGPVNSSHKWPVTRKMFSCDDVIMEATGNTGYRDYRQTSNISRALVGNKLVYHSDVDGASPVGAAPTTSSFST